MKLLSRSNESSYTTTRGLILRRTFSSFTPPPSLDSISTVWSLLIDTHTFLHFTTREIQKLSQNNIDHCENGHKTSSIGDVKCSVMKHVSRCVDRAYTHLCTTTLSRVKAVFVKTVFGTPRKHWSQLCFGLDYAEKHRRMGPGGHFCRSDNAPQDGDSVGVAGAAHSRHHPASSAGPRHPSPPVFAVSNPATEAEDNPGRSTSETSGSQFTI